MAKYSVRLASDSLSESSPAFLQVSIGRRYSTLSNLGFDFLKYPGQSLFLVLFIFLTSKAKCCKASNRKLNHVFDLLVISRTLAVLLVKHLKLQPTWAISYALLTTTKVRINHLVLAIVMLILRRSVRGHCTCHMIPQCFFRLSNLVQLLQQPGKLYGQRLVGSRIFSLLL